MTTLGSATKSDSISALAPTIRLSGARAGFNLTSGNSNVFVGRDAGDDVTTADEVVAINNSGANTSHTTWIGNIYGVTTNSGVTLPVIVSNDGQLGTTASSRRFKKEIKPMNKASEAILALRPVTFQYQTDSTNTPQFGLVAEDVEKIDPELVVRDEQGKPYTVRYDAVNAMLLNEFLKEHRKVAEQQGTIQQLKATAAQQQKQIEALTAGLHKLSARMELHSPAPRTAANN